MTSMRHVVLVALIALAPWPGAAQTSDAPLSAALGPAEMEKFLRSGRIIKKKESSTGVTDAYRVTLSDGVLTHDAQVQNVDIAKALFEVGPKHTEVNFKDTYRYNVAAYRLAVMLGLDNVPVSVERNVDGQPAAVTWWIEGVMTEGDREKKQVPHANPLRAAEYQSRMYVFDELIQNRDRNKGNMLWAPDSRMWMIDHTRSFRVSGDLRQTEVLHRVERAMLQTMRALDRESFTKVVGKTLTKDEIRALFLRRDRLVQFFDQKIAALGEGKVLYTIR